jgi:hypothetical protein
MYVLVFVELFDYSVDGLAACLEPNNSFAFNGVIPRPER